MTPTPDERLNALSTARPQPQAVRTPSPAHDAAPAPAAALQRALASPTVRPADVLALQRAVGNRAVQRMLASSRPVIQAKLTVNAPGDVYEQEADNVARQVVASLSQPVGPAADAVQRDDLDDDELVRKPLLQRDPTPEDEDKLHLKPSPVQRTGGEGAFDVDDGVESAIESARGGGQALDSGTRGQMEGALGVDLSGVRVHTDTRAADLSTSVQARAFTTQKDIFFNQGEYNPGSTGGKELLAHELTHVVQQNGPALARKDTDEKG